jgi:hypothetical protein
LIRHAQVSSCTLTAVRDPHFWSARVNQDVRIIIHKTEASFLLAYVDHHDKAYAWAERRRIEAHPRTGVIQIVEVHERAEEAGPLFVECPGKPEPSPAAIDVKPLFADLNADDLLDIGTPTDWVEDVLHWTEDQFFHFADKLPAEVAEALLDYADTGRLAKPDAVEGDPYAHPDTLRRVRTVTSEEELRLALDFPWEKWSVFLHPSQHAIVERSFAGPARVTGTAGTGKTVVALHRAARALQEDLHARILLTSFSRPLASALRPKLSVLTGHDAHLQRRVSVLSFEDAAAELYQLATGRRPALAGEDVQRSALEMAIGACGYSGMTERMVWAEWRHVVDGWCIADAEAYAAVPRTGRQNRMGVKQREAVWPVFETMRRSLETRGLMTLNQLQSAVATHFGIQSVKPYTHVIVDEAQDLSVGALRMMAAIASGPDAHFYAGDLGQRIFQHPFSWKALGVDVRGRSSSLRINYRTSRQIREAADRLLPSKVTDADGLDDVRTGAQSVFEGPAPNIQKYKTVQEEVDSVSAFLLTSLAEGIAPSEMGIFVRSPKQLARARDAAAAAGCASVQLSEAVIEREERIAVGTMHHAKGLEFKIVAVMACDDVVLPSQEQIDGAATEEELKEIFDTERHLLYVACTRARDRLHISGVAPVSEFLDDLALEHD